MPIAKTSLAFILLLGALSALPPLGVDMNLPAIPAMASSLGVAVSGASMSLSAFLAGFALAPLFLAPLSDYFGRRPVLLGGLSLFALAGLLCAAAPSLGWVLAGRLFQGMGAGIGTAMPLAIIRDSFEGPVARSRLSHMTTVLNMAPLLAPSFGALVLPWAGWRGIFLVLGLGGVLLLALCALSLGESLRQPRQAGSHPRRLPRAYAEVLRHGRIVGFCFVNGLSFACLFSFVSGSPLVMMTELGLSPRGFGLTFAGAACGLITGSLLSARLAAHRHDRVLLGALCLNAATTMTLFLTVLSGVHFLGVILPLIMVSQLSYGIAAPHAVHEAMQPMPQRAGVVSALLRGLQMLAGSAASAVLAWLVGLGAHPSLAMSGLMAANTLAALLLFLLLSRGRASQAG